MNEYSTSYATYPVKINCRTATLSRLRKLRLSWFIAGAAFSIGCTSALTPLFNHSELITASKQNDDAAEENMTINSQDTALLENIIGASPAEITPQPELVEVEVTSKTQSSSADYPQSIELKIKKGDTLVGLLSSAGISADDAKSTFDAVRTVFNPRKLDIGSSITVQIDKDTDGNTIIRGLKLPISAISTIELNRTHDDHFAVKRIDAPLTKKLARAGGAIDSSIYQTGADSGIPSAMLNEMINAYSYDVDFQRDVKKGDSIDVLFERMETKDGNVAGNGNFVFSELTLGERVLKIYRYADKSGNADFYNEKGESIRKALLRTPINGARITSSFGMRNHPISGYTKMHRGVDFGAAIGTPIYAAGDGIVETASAKNGYGNYLKIKHNDKYASAYAHLSRYASGVSPGKRVRQGQIVAYVGMTGATTGPHLHYEIMVNNEQINPANVKFKTGNVLQGKELAAFRANMNKIEARLASISRGDTVAMADEPTSKSTN